MDTKGSEWPKNGWMLVEPKYIGDGTGNNVHILPVKYTGPGTNGILWEVPTYKTIDGCSLEVSKDIRPLKGSLVYYDTPAGRAKLITAANIVHEKGFMMCANCQGHLCADAEEEKTE